MLQLRPRGTNDPMYAPMRDIAYVSHYLYGRALQSLDKINWNPAIRDFITTTLTTEEDIASAAIFLANFIKAAPNVDPDNTYMQVLEQTGFYTLPAGAQIAVLSAIGEQILGAYFIGIRQVTHKGEPPPIDIAAFVKDVDATVRILRIPAWRRWLHKCLLSARDWIVTTLTGKSNKVDPVLLAGPDTNKLAVLPTTTAPASVVVLKDLPDNLPLPGEQPKN